MIAATATQPDEAVRCAGGLSECVTPTRLNTWLSCPLKFKFRYKDRIKEPTMPSLFIGKVVHSGLEHFYRHRQHDIAVDTAQVLTHMCDTWEKKVAAENVFFDSLEDEESAKHKATSLVETYLNQRPADEPLPLAVEAAMESPLIDPEAGEDLGVSLFGIVDLVLGGSDGPIIIDFKTAAKSAAPLDIAHEVQLSCYSYLFRCAFNRTEREMQIRSLIKTKTPKCETHSYPARGEAHFRRLFAVIRAYLDDLHSNRFVYRPNWTCSMCSFRETHCREWQGS